MRMAWQWPAATGITVTWHQHRRSGIVAPSMYRLFMAVSCLQQRNRPSLALAHVAARRGIGGGGDI